jgi:hypothetical protein
VFRRGMGVLAAMSAALIVAAGSAADAPLFSKTVFFRIVYRTDCTFMVTIDGGIALDSTNPTLTATIPPGPYQISVTTPLPDDQWNTAYCTVGNFSLTGPGLNYAAVLGLLNGPFGSTFTQTLAPSSTYTITDATHPANPVTITTAATGTSTDLLPPPPPSTAKGGSRIADYVGSGIVPYRGALSAGVGAAGKATLAAHGKRVASLVAGRYDIVVRDGTTAGGFFVEKAGRKPQTIAGVRFHGERKVRVTLTAGKWTFFSKTGHATPFLVTPEE